MPWRANTLTKFAVGKSDDATSDSDRGLEHVGLDPSAVKPGQLHGAGASEDILFGVFAEDVHETECNVFQLEEPDLVKGRCSPRKGALDLKAKLVPRGPTLNEASFEQHLSHAFLSTRGQIKVVMPWEKGVFKKIFKKQPEDQLQSLFKQPRHWVGLDAVPEVETSEELSSATGSRHQLVGAFYEHALSSVSDQSFLQQRQSILETAVEKWFCIIRVNMLASSIGHDIIGLGNMEEQRKGAFQIIEAVIGVRSRTTAITRANALLKFLRWRADNSDSDGKDFSETEAWTYLIHLRESSAAPTRATSFLSACAYALHVFGFLGLEAICSSRRLKGLAELMHSAKAPLKQALVLTVGQVMFLHGKLAEQSCNHVDRAIVAYLLIALYGRCRHSDLQNVEEVILDFGPEGGFLEITTKTHKTARTVAQKTKLLPVVIPAIGINGSEWISEAKSALEEYGLKLEGHIGGPLFRPPGSSGEPHCKRGITSAEVTRFLRLMLEEEASIQKDTRVSSHEVVEPTPKCFRHFAVGPLSGRFVMHDVSKLVHYADPSFVDGRGARMISCGRSLNQNYKYITQFDSVDVCKRCKSNAVKDGALPKALA